MKPIANGIHSGLRTHNHDQAITLSSFKTINAIANNPQNPTPPDFVVDDTLLILVIKLNLLKSAKGYNYYTLFKNS